MHENEAYWQPQPPEAASPQHEAFSDGSQHEACLTGEQQLDVSAPGCGMPAWPRSCADGDASTDRSTPVVSIRILLFNPIPVRRVNQRRTTDSRRSRQEVNVDHAHQTSFRFAVPARRVPPLTSAARPSIYRDGDHHEKTHEAARRPAPPGKGEISKDPTIGGVDAAEEDLGWPQRWQHPMQKEDEPTNGAEPDDSPFSAAQAAPGAQGCPRAPSFPRCVHCGSGRCRPRRRPRSGDPWAHGPANPPGAFPSR